MSMLFLYIVLGMLIITIVILAVWFCWDHRAQIHDIREVRKHYHKKDALLLDYYRTEPVMSPDKYRDYMTVTKGWMPIDKENVDEPYAKAYMNGYYIAEKWMSNLRYAGIPVFVRIHNFKLCDTRE